MGVLAGAGQLVSSANDMVIFLQGLTGISSSPLSLAFRELNKPIANVRGDGFGYGMAIKESQDGGKIYVKTGNTSGFSSVIVWRTRPRIGFVILSNRGRFSQINQFALRLIERSTLRGVPVTGG
jgi:CubicO group peptidase (beta-lactamase class C family)